MIYRSIPGILAATTALCAVSAAPASAQTLEAACERLRAMAETAGDGISPEFADAPDIAEANDPANCVAFITLVEERGGIDRTASTPSGSDPAPDAVAEGEDPVEERETESFSTSETVSDTVEITKEAVVEGEVVVTMPDPEVSVDQPGAEVAVRQQPADVSVTQPSADIVVRQAPASINVSIPQPRITIDQPAPEIIITMPRPGVSLDQAQPEVEVRMAEPTVNVTQADPELDVDVDARLVDEGAAEATQSEGVVTRTERAPAGEGDADTDNLTVASGDPQVNVTAAEEQANVTFEQSEPTVRYEAADPSVEVAYDGEPDIEMRQVGEPTVRFVEAGATEDAQTASRERMSPEASQALLSEADPERYGSSDVQSVTVGDIVGRDVLTVNDEQVGEVGDVVMIRDRAFLVVQHGGFLGFGEEEMPLPLERVALRGDDVLLLGLTEEDFETMPEYSIEDGEPVESDKAISLGMVE